MTNEKKKNIACPQAHAPPTPSKPSAFATLSTLKDKYKRLLHSFEEFDEKLGKIRAYKAKYHELLKIIELYYEQMRQALYNVTTLMDKWVPPNSDIIQEAYALLFKRMN